MFSAPVLAGLGTHGCCPEQDQSVASKIHTMSSHFEHLALQDAGPTQVKGAVHDNSTEFPCDISCCANVAGTGIVGSNQPVLVVEYHLASGFFPVNDIAVSAADNLHTPPPRIS
jgi:hypothetical protein